MNNLHLSDEAQADLAGIKSYIAKNLENPSAAISTVRNITKDIRRLREHSLIGASLSSIADVESDYRFLVTGSYLTFYRVLDNDVYVDRVRYGRRDYLRILFGDVQKGHKFEFPVYWGVDLASEHERYLVEDHFKRPVILTDYPKEIKAFYMKQNEDGKTVRAMDVLFPKIGEIIGGSERESDYNKLMTRIDELHIPMKDMWWYLDTRKFGTCPHSGFGLGFERLLLFVTGMTNIRDVIPFPRTPRNAEF